MSAAALPGNWVGTKSDVISAAWRARWQLLAVIGLIIAPTLAISAAADLLYNGPGVAVVNGRLYSPPEQHPRVILAVIVVGWLLALCAAVAIIGAAAAGNERVGIAGALRRAVLALPGALAGHVVTSGIWLAVVHVALIRPAAR